MFCDIASGEWHMDVDIDSGNDLVPPGKQLPEPLLTKFYHPIQRH